MAQHGQLSAEDAKIVRWAKDQHERRGGFIRIFPRAETWSTYGGLLELKTHTNELLAQRLFPETYRPGSAVVRSRHLEKPGEGERFERYERRLESLNKKRRKKKKLKSKKAKQKKTDIKTIDDEIEDEDDEPIKMREPIMNAVPAPPIQSVISVSNSGDTERKDVVPRDNIVKSEVYKSIRAARERKKNGEDQKYSPPSIQPPTKDAKLDISLVDESGDRDKKTEKTEQTEQQRQGVMSQIIKKLKIEAGRLCQVEAREAFAAYLNRVQRRFAKESQEKTRIYHRAGSSTFR